jgi:hypothetical protein
VANLLWKIWVRRAAVPPGQDGQEMKQRARLV